MQLPAIAGALLLAIAGCASVAERGAEISDGALESAELVLCRGITVGAWVRAYGDRPEKAAAWRVICSSSIDEAPR